MKYKVLWIEDNAFTDLDNMSGPVYNAVKYDLVTAINATDGLQKLQDEQKTFDAVIVDVRLPPGTDEEFVKRFNESGENKVEARLGLMLLERVLAPRNEDHNPLYYSKHPEKFGILTAESWQELKDHLTRFHISEEAYEQKMEKNPKTMLLDIIQKVIKKSVSEVS